MTLIHIVLLLYSRKSAKSKTQLVKKLKKNQLYKPKNMLSRKIVSEDLVNSENTDDDDDDDQKLLSTDHITSTAKKAITPSNLKNEKKQSNSHENINESSSSLERKTLGIFFHIILIYFG